MAGHTVDASSLLKQICGSDHHLRRDTRPVRTLTAEKGSFDAHDIQSCLGQAQHEILASGSDPQHNDINLLSHNALRCRATWLRARETGQTDRSLRAKAPTFALLFPDVPQRRSAAQGDGAQPAEPPAAVGTMVWVFPLSPIKGQQARAA
jgi:hypothetical protein